MLLLWGRQDEILPPSLADKWAAALGPEQSQLVWVEGAGHSPHLEKASFVATHMASFIRKLGLGQSEVDNGKEEVELTAQSGAVVVGGR